MFGSFDTPKQTKSGGQALDFTVTEAELNPVNTYDELSQPWAELALKYMQGSPND